MESLASPDILKELHGRLVRVKLDHLLDTGYLAELIRDEPYSPFEMIGSTERPDSVVGKIMEGRIALLIEGSPFVLTLPYVFVENFHVRYFQPFAQSGGGLHVDQYSCALCGPDRSAGTEKLEHHRLPDRDFFAISQLQGR